MYSKYPQFEKAIKDNIITPGSLKENQPGYGVVLHYDPTDNTAIVLMARPNSDDPGDIFRNVPCPVMMGLQTAAPEPGRMAWITFRDGTQSTPMISHFFSFSYSENDHDKQNYASNKLPSFMLEL